MIDEEKLYEYLRDGKSQAEIARIFGVSRQAVSDYIRKPKRRRRTREEMFRAIPYKGLREYMQKTPGMKVSKLASILFQTTAPYAYQKTHRLLSGEAFTLKLDQIWRLIAVSGMTFEELFEKEVSGNDEARQADKRIS